MIITLKNNTKRKNKITMIKQKIKKLSKIINIPVLFEPDLEVYKHSKIRNSRLLDFAYKKIEQSNHLQDKIVFIEDFETELIPKKNSYKNNNGRIEFEL